MCGYLMRRWKIVDEAALSGFNKVCFQLLLSSNLFYSIYTSDLSEVIDVSLLTFCLAGLFLECGLGLLIIPRLEKNNATRGALMQGMFRTNLVLVGLPIVVGVYGEELGPFPVIIAVMVPMYNVMGAILLEHYRPNGGGKIQPGKILLQIAKNPLVVGAVLGIIMVSFQIRLPEFMEKTVSYLSRSATAVALLILGASLHLDAIKGNRKRLIFSLTLRLGILPVLAVAAAAALGYRDVELLSVLMVFGCPLGTVTYVIAQQMDSDAELAGELVIFSTLLSCFTLFLQIFALMSLQLI